MPKPSQPPFLNQTPTMRAGLPSEITGPRPNMPSRSIGAAGLPGSGMRRIGGMAKDTAANQAVAVTVQWANDPRRKPGGTSGYNDISQDSIMFVVRAPSGLQHALNLAAEPSRQRYEGYSLQALNAMLFNDPTNAHHRTADDIMKRYSLLGPVSSVTRPTAEERTRQNTVASTIGIRGPHRSYNHWYENENGSPAPGSVAYLVLRWFKRETGPQYNENNELRIQLDLAVKKLGHKSDEEVLGVRMDAKDRSEKQAEGYGYPPGQRRVTHGSGASGYDPSATPNMQRQLAQLKAENRRGRESVGYATAIRTPNWQPNDPRTPPYDPTLYDNARATDRQMKEINDRARAEAAAGDTKFDEKNAQVGENSAKAYQNLYYDANATRSAATTVRRRGVAGPRLRNWQPKPDSGAGPYQEGAAEAAKQMDADRERENEEIRRKLQAAVAAGITQEAFVPQSTNGYETYMSNYYDAGEDDDASVPVGGGKSGGGGGGGAGNGANRAPPSASGGTSGGDTKEKAPGKASTLTLAFAKRNTQIDEEQKQKFTEAQKQQFADEKKNKFVDAETQENVHRRLLNAQPSLREYPHEATRAVYNALNRASTTYVAEGYWQFVPWVSHSRRQCPDVYEYTQYPSSGVKVGHAIRCGTFIWLDQQVSFAYRDGQMRRMTHPTSAERTSMGADVAPGCTILWRF